MRARIVWYREQRTLPNGYEKSIRIAWIIADDPASPSGSPRHLAYLGADPTITAQLTEEFSALYPDVQVDWGALAEEARARQTDVEALSLDELAFKLRAILGESEIVLDQLDFRLGKGWRRPLRQMEMFVRDPGVVARFERTSGSVFAYLREKHPESAYALLKARILLLAGEDGLSAVEADEPPFEPGSRFTSYRAHCRRALDEFDPPATT